MKMPGMATRVGEKRILVEKKDLTGNPGKVYPGGDNLPKEKGKTISTPDGRDKAANKKGAGGNPACRIWGQGSNWQKGLTS